jgi:NAD(P)-dependent dehydrogenase (short-subunit alcohol dehydrogenase family)
VDLELTGKRALVTGGSRGIGKAIARQLALEGADVVISARGVPDLKTTVAELAAETGRTIVAAVCDTGDDAQVQDLVAAATQALGGIDILVNNAARVGVGMPGTLAETTPQALWDELNVKVAGYLRCAREVAPQMTARGWGRIINISGLNARRTGSAIASMRNVSVAALTKNLADELGPHGVNVTVVHPGFTATERVRGIAGALSAERGITLQEASAQLAANAIGRIVTPEEVAYVVAFLASPKSVSMTGDPVVVGGGALGSIHY